MSKYRIEGKLLELLEEEGDKCIGCKLCMKGCPMLDLFTDNPQVLLQDLAEEGLVDYHIPYSCMLCGYCTEVCPKSVDLNNLFFEMRNSIFEDSEGRLPKNLAYGGVRFHQKNSFSQFFSSPIKNLNSDSIFFPGCSLMAYSPDLVEKTYAYLGEKIEGIGIYVTCCGNPSLSMGDRDRFESYFSQVEEDLRAQGVRRLVTACLNCYKTLAGELDDIEVLTVWEIFGQEGIPERRLGIGRDYDLELVLHDPCPTRDVDGIHQGVRKILDQLGFEVLEMRNKESRTLCCGSGAMVGVINPKIGEKRKRERANEVEGDVVVSYCQECVGSMRQGGKASIHVLDLLFNDHIYENFDQVDMGTIKRWLNRFKGRNKFNKY